MDSFPAKIGFHRKNEVGNGFRNSPNSNGNRPRLNAKTKWRLRPRFKVQQAITGRLNDSQKIERMVHGKNKNDSSSREKTEARQILAVGALRYLQCVGLAIHDEQSMSELLSNRLQCQLSPQGRARPYAAQTCQAKAGHDTRGKVHSRQMSKRVTGCNRDVTNNFK